jgi:hypothetical protein
MNRLGLVIPLLWVFTMLSSFVLKKVGRSNQMETKQAVIEAEHIMQQDRKHPLYF